MTLGRGLNRLSQERNKNQSLGLPNKLMKVLTKNGNNKEKK